MKARHKAVVNELEAANKKIKDLETKIYHLQMDLNCQKAWCESLRKENSQHTKEWDRRRKIIKDRIARGEGQYFDVENEVELLKKARVAPIEHFNDLVKKGFITPDGRITKMIGGGADCEQS